MGLFDVFKKKSPGSDAEDDSGPSALSLANQAEGSKAASVRLSGTGVLRGIDGSQVLLSSSFEDFCAVLDAIRARSEGRETQDVPQGRLVAAGATATIIDSKLDSVIKVRVLDGPDSGHEGWTFKSWVDLP